MDLMFDKMTVDITLAQEYLRNEIQQDNQDKWFDGKQYRADSCEIPYSSYEHLQAKLQVIESKLKENRNLIAQLEYLIREIPLIDTLAQLDLIIQQTNYVSSQLKRTRKIIQLASFSNTIVMGNDSPLLLLGNIVKTVLREHTDNCVWLEHEDKTKIICQLFSKLCHQSDLPVFSRSKQTECITGIYQAPIGTVGVISEFSDIDSATDIFLTSSEHVPWRLQNILVQESVYQQFKDALAWKCKLNKQMLSKSTNTTADMFEYNDRVFLTDRIDNTALKAGTVVIEAYRTRKELKLLLKKYRPHYFSLWANDIAEINEMVYNIHSPIVWVNSFGDFRGPPKISESLFYNEGPSETIHVTGLLELKESWLNLDLKARRDIICNALDKCATVDVSHSDHYTTMKNDLLKIDIFGGTLIDVGKNYVCLCLSAPSTRLFRKEQTTLNIGFLTTLLQGNAFVLRSPLEVQIANIFKQEGIPVLSIDQNDKATTNCVVYDCEYEDNDLIDITMGTKVIWTNSGTIFAN